MATRLNLRQADSVRQTIKIARLLEELQKHVDGKRDMTKTQIQAAKILIDKSLGNAITEVAHDISGGIDIRQIQRVIIDPSADSNA